MSRGKFTDEFKRDAVAQVEDRGYLSRNWGVAQDFKALHSAQATIAGIETAHMIRKGQIPTNGCSAFQQFADLAA